MKKSRAQRKDAAAKAMMVEANQLSQPLSKEAVTELEEAKMLYLSRINNLVNRMALNPGGTSVLSASEQHIVLAALIREQKFWGSNGSSR